MCESAHFTTINKQQQQLISSPLHLSECKLCARFSLSLSLVLFAFSSQFCGLSQSINRPLSVTFRAHFEEQEVKATAIDGQLNKKQVIKLRKKEIILLTQSFAFNAICSLLLDFPLFDSLQQQQLIYTLTRAFL